MHTLPKTRKKNLFSAEVSSFLACSEMFLSVVDGFWWLNRHQCITFGFYFFCLFGVAFFRLKWPFDAHKNRIRKMHMVDRYTKESKAKQKFV